MARILSVCRVREARAVVRAQAPVRGIGAQDGVPGRREFTSVKWDENSRMTVPESEHRLAEPLLTDILGELEGWERQGDAITKTYQLKGWKAAMAFANQVADAATAANHHPDVHIERYKYVRIVLTTHVSHGISQADIDLAKAIDALVST
jgi:4a-hydroxytetrahydrobiopterin dehydratase